MNSIVSKKMKFEVITDELRDGLEGQMIACSIGKSVSFTNYLCLIKGIKDIFCYKFCMLCAVFVWFG